MNKFIKGLLILVVVSIALTVVERWYNIFFLGRLFENVGIGTALLGFAVPVVTTVGAIYAGVRIVRFKI